METIIIPFGWYDIFEIIFTSIIFISLYEYALKEYNKKE
jgi:hypothetical protein